ncbi:hypothetical protein CKO42_13060 [Lamprobacter modestohalophilus]|uniref:HTH cro/C1-type domain-containing protein n=1 Tax=Lamprobacter modestohalophilus TaxID=1064514 RepID=A0A9X1B530_9GAMM|nr:helix-turn-helix transcriptional regulator [Lamprobacter modestohalophilus]MBK1619351.1 hypothetical protein [Lamprobacter modestohalophilus]
MTTETSPTADLLAFYRNNSPLTQVEVAQRVGYKPNVISMFKLGTSPIPIAKIPALSKVLEIDPQRFLRTALAEYHTEMLEVIESIYGQLLTENEAILLKRFRDDLPDDDALFIDSDAKYLAFENLLCVMGNKEAVGGPDCGDQAPRTTKAMPDFTAFERPAAPFSPGDEIAKILTLRDLGILSEAEFERLKSWVLKAS